VVIRQTPERISLTIAAKAILVPTLHGARVLGNPATSVASFLESWGRTHHNGAWHQSLRPKIVRGAGTTLLRWRFGYAPWCGRRLLARVRAKCRGLARSVQSGGDM